jgi:hypothetical protein
MGAPARRRRGLSAQAADAAVDQACRQLRLPSVRTLFTDMVTTAEKEQLTYQGFLAELLLAECDDRARRRSIRRVKAAGFPREKWLGDFDFEANPNINPATIHTLASSAWVRAGEPLCLIGDSGTGKSHLLIALGTAAAEAGFRVLRQSRSHLRRRARLHGARPSRRRAAFPGIDRARRKELRRHRLQRIILRMDQNLHRPTPMRSHRGPTHVRRQHHRNRHPFLPTRPHQSGPHRHDLNPF